MCVKHKEVYYNIVKNDKVKEISFNSNFAFTVKIYTVKIN